jgi:hypothetical protein
MNAQDNTANSTNTQDVSFPGALLNIAQWLDSQDEHNILAALISGVKISETFVTRKEWESTMRMMDTTESRYYHPETTNSERVLAVLMLREMILSGDL